jgi:hypothetical protein
MEKGDNEVATSKRSRLNRHDALEHIERAVQAWRQETLTKIAADLTAHKVEVPLLWRSCTDPEKRYLGECFDRALRFIGTLGMTLARDDPTRDDLWLVHGEYLDWGEYTSWQPHGWVELPGGVVFDGNLQQFYERVGYYETVHAQPWYKYSVGAAVLIEANMPRNPDGTIPVGDWHAYLGLPFADPNNPTIIDFDQARELIHTTGLNARRWLGKLGALRTGVWMSAAEWAKSVSRLRLTRVFVPELDGRSADGRTRGIEHVLEANVDQNLVEETRTEYLTMRLEKRVQADAPPRYRFRVIGRRERRPR